MLETMLTELAAGEGVNLILQKKDINQISYEVANEKAASPANKGRRAPEKKKHKSKKQDTTTIWIML